jgi:hypothetical protein
VRLAPEMYTPLESAVHEAPEHHIQPREPFSSELHTQGNVSLATRVSALLQLRLYCTHAVLKVTHHGDRKPARSFPLSPTTVVIRSQVIRGRIKVCPKNREPRAWCDAENDKFPNQTVDGRRKRHMPSGEASTKYLTSAIHAWVDCRAFHQVSINSKPLGRLQSTPPRTEDWGRWAVCEASRRVPKERSCRPRLLQTQCRTSEGISNGSWFSHVRCKLHSTDAILHTSFIHHYRVPWNDRPTASSSSATTTNLNRPETWTL